MNLPYPEWLGDDYWSVSWEDYFEAFYSDHVAKVNAKICQFTLMH